MTRLLWIRVGGAVGTGLRYALSSRVLARFGPALNSETLARPAAGGS